MNELVGEDLAALDAALAFFDEWDLDDVGGGLGELRVSADPTVARSAAATSNSCTPATLEPQERLTMLESEPLAVAATAITTAHSSKRSNSNGTAYEAPLQPASSDEYSFGELVSAALRGTSFAGVKPEPLVSSTPPSPSSKAPSTPLHWDDAVHNTEVCAVAVDRRPRENKKKRRDDPALQDPRALALQAVNLRVKRRRQKEELLELRLKVQHLESRLTQIKSPSAHNQDAICASMTAALTASSSSSNATAAAPTKAAAAAEHRWPTQQQQQPAIQHRSPLGVVWERLAARQQKERERAEEENQKLKEMLDEHVKLARSLDRILRKRATAQRLSPDGMVITAHDSVGEARHEDVSRVNTLVIDLEGLYSEIDAIAQRFGVAEQLATPFRDTKLRKNAHDGSAFLESMDSRVLPFDMQSTGATVWQFLADESGGLARIYYQNCTNMTEDIRTCTYGIEMQHKETKAAFWGTSAMRKYVENGRLVISWSGQFEPVNAASASATASASTSDAAGLRGFVFRHKGWVDIAPLAANPTEAVVMQSYYCIEPELADPSGVDDPNAKISALMDFVISTTDARLDASHQFIENNLMKDLLRK